MSHTFNLELNQGILTYNRAFVALTNDFVSGVLLGQIIYWFKPNKFGKIKGGQFRDGKWWIARSKAEWYRDIGITPYQYDGAIRRLVSLGFVEQRYFKWAGNRVCHLWLNVAAMESLLQGEVGKAGLGKSQMSAFGGGENPPPYTLITSTTTDNDSVLGNAKSVANSKTKSNESKVHGEEQGKGKEKKKKFKEELRRKVNEEVHCKIDVVSTNNACEIVQVTEAGTQHNTSQTPQKPAKVNARSLFDYWMKLGGAAEDATKKEPTSRELGMLAYYRQITGHHALPAMEWALKDWERFRYRAKEQGGCGLRATPWIGSLVKACDVAADGYIKDKKALSPTIPVIIPTVKVTRDALATDEEIAAMLADT